MASVRDAKLKPRGYQQINGLAAATALTVPAGAAYALIKVETATVRWRDDGTDPTAAVGMLLDVGDEFWYTGELTKIKFIQTSAAVLNICYYS